MRRSSLLQRDWFERRKTANNTIDQLIETEALNMQDDQTCWHLGDRFSGGGHSDLYYYPGNDFVLIRTISKDPNNHYITEIKNNHKVSQAVIRDINPHFTLSYFITPCHDVYHQIIERLDGDIRSFSVDILRETHFLPQMLMGLVTLLRNNIRINDVKRENILYKHLDQPVGLVYIIDDETYTITTNTIYFYTDLGMSSPYYDHSPYIEDQVKNLTDLHGILKINRGDVVIRTFDLTIIEGLAFRDAICRLELTRNISAIISQIGRSSIDLLRCVKRLLRTMKMEQGIISESPPSNIPSVVFSPDSVI